MQLNITAKVKSFNIYFFNKYVSIMLYFSGRTEIAEIETVL